MKGVKRIYHNLILQNNIKNTFNPITFSTERRMPIKKSIKIPNQENWPRDSVGPWQSTVSNALKWATSLFCPPNAHALLK